MRKSEIRNPKSERNPNRKIHNRRRRAAFSELSKFEVPSDFGFRISDFLLFAVLTSFTLNSATFAQPDPARQLSEALRWSSQQVAPAVVTIPIGDKNTKSGVIVDSDGFVLTSFRAVQGQTAVTVRASGGTAQGKVVATDRDADLALIKLDGKNFPFARLGDSDTAQVGDWVSAIGLTQGVARNAMHGIISSPARRVASRDNIGTVALLQTTCAADNSSIGAPLVNLRGEVIGIVSYFPTKGGGEWSQGLSHASPINRAKQLLEKTKGAPVATPAQPAAPQESLQTARDLSEAIRWCADQIKPATVVIQSRQIASGFFVDSRGYILTALGSLSNGEAVKVAIGAEAQPQRDGKVVAVDSASDLALVKIDGANFPVARLGDSDQARIGEFVIAVGAPFGFSQSVTCGVVSFRARKVGTVETPMIQASVPFDAGGSGAPLLNAEGEVIGVCRSTRANAPFAGNAYAVPINAFKARLLGQIPR
jgi:S1-C subfamily serine protease